MLPLNKPRIIIKMEAPQSITTSMANMMPTKIQVNGMKTRTGKILGNNKIMVLKEMLTMDTRSKITMRRRILWQSWRTQPAPTMMASSDMILI